MKKILNNKDLLEQFKRDKEVMPQKQIAEKYSISLSSITRLINQIKQQSFSNQSQISEHSEQSQQQNSNEELDTQNNQSKSIHEQSNEEQPLSESIHEQSNEECPSSKNIQSSNSIEEIQQDEQIIDKSLINYLNKNDSIEIQKKRKEKIDQPIIKPQIIQQPQPVIVQQIDLQQNGEDENEIQNFMIKIRKMIQFFKNESCIHSIIGSTDFQQQKFIYRLYLKNLEEIKLINKTIQFELLFSRLNSFMQDTIESSALFIERLLLSLDINVVGCFQELQEDEEFQFYYQLMLCDNSFIASAKQIIFMKFIKNYYKKYSENKSNTSIDFKQKLKEQANKELLERFNKL